MRRLHAGDVILYDQDSPSVEVHQPGDNVGYRADSPTTWTHSPDEKRGVPPGHGLPNQHHDEASPPTSRVTQNGVTDFVSGEATYPKYAALISDVLAQVGPDVIARAGAIPFKISRVLPGKGFWSFAVSGSKGEVYSVRLKVLRKGNAKGVAKHHVQVSCDCPFFRWQGPEHWAKVNRYLYGKPVGTASKPDVKDPEGKHWACKHVVAVLNRAREYRFASQAGLNLTGATIEPGPSARIVARKFAISGQMRTAARPIHIDRASVEHLVERLIAKLARQAQRNPHDAMMGTHRKEIVGDEITVRTVMGLPSNVRVALISEPSHSPHFVLGGGFGHVRDGGSPVIIVELNGKYPWSAFADPMVIQRELHLVLMHELTHAADVESQKPAAIQGRIPSTAEMDLAAYYNDPHEVRANMRELYERIRGVVQKIMGSRLGAEWGLGGTIIRALNMDSDWKVTTLYLSPKSKATILRGIVRAFEDDLGLP